MINPPLPQATHPSLTWALAIDVCHCNGQLRDGPCWAQAIERTWRDEEAGHALQVRGGWQQIIEMTKRIIREYKDGDD